MNSPSFQISVSAIRPFPTTNALIARMRDQIQAEEDKRIFEILEKISCCEDPCGIGICEKCGLPVNKEGCCPIWDISNVMES